MAIWTCLLALAASVPVLAAGPGARAWLVGGTVTTLPAKGEARLDLAGPDELLVRSEKGELRIAYKKINQIEYGQNVSRRYAAAIVISPVLLLSKSRKHFVTLCYTDQEGRQQALVLRVDKADVRAVLAGLEARSGRRVEYQDAEARKAGKG